MGRQFESAVAHEEKEVRSELEEMKEERGGGGGKREAALSKIGPWGGSAGRAHSIKVAPHRLESVTIWSADIIDAFAFSYSDHNGNKHTIGPLGGPGGKVCRIKFAPSQFLLEVSGTIGPYASAVADVLQTLTLVTNSGSYGPFGHVGGGTPFHTSIQSNDRIVGFFGRGGMFVHAIGVYVRHFERMVQGGKEVIFGLDEEVLAKIGPWGGNGGMAYDMKVAPHRLETLTICSGVVVDSLAFSYDDLNGKQHTAGPWGGPSGNPYTIRLGSFEFLTGVSGTVGSFGTIPNVITSLMFTTNMGNSYGPLGQGGGTPFRIPVENNGCIVGFFGRAGSCVEALGVYIRTY